MMDDMDEDYDGPQDMEETVAQISALYNEVIPPLQNALAVIQGPRVIPGVVRPRMGAVRCCCGF